MISFKGRWFEREAILTCVRWYLAYPLSYRNLEEMMAERGLQVDHSTIQRWVFSYSPQLRVGSGRGRNPTLRVFPHLFGHLYSPVMRI